MISFELSEDQRAIRDLARKFAQEEIAPVAVEYDRSGEFPWDIARKAFEVGLMNFNIPTEYGGGGLSTLDSCLVAEELGAGCTGITAALLANVLAATPLLVAGTEEQKRKYLGQLSEEPRFAAYCMTEPGAGSDVVGIASTAERVGEGYVLNGTKRFITCGGVATWYVVFAYTDRERRHKGMSAFIVPADSGGVIPGKKEEMMGQRASNTTEVIFENVPVRRDQLLGKEGEGFSIAMRAFDHTRPIVSAGAVGLARSALAQAQRYSVERRAFGQRLADLGVIRSMLAQMATQVDAARLLVWQAGWRYDRGERNTKEAAFGKLFAADAAMRITTDAVQILGGYGFSTEYPVEKLMRDAKVMQIYEGTSQIQEVVIARELVQEAGG